jgi:hypothetical protein
MRSIRLKLTALPWLISSRFAIATIVPHLRAYSQQPFSRSIGLSAIQVFGLLRRVQNWVPLMLLAKGQPWMKWASTARPEPGRAGSDGAWLTPRPTRVHRDLPHNGLHD